MRGYVSLVVVDIKMVHLQKQKIFLYKFSKKRKQNTHRVFLYETKHLRDVICFECFQNQTFDMEATT